MFLLSKLLNDYAIYDKCEFINEQPFSVLALTASITEKSNCVFLDDEKFINSIKDNTAMVITNSRMALQLINEHRGVCIVNKPRIVFFKLHNFLSNNAEYCNKLIDTTVDKSCSISPYSYIAEQGVSIGKNTKIEEFVSIKENVAIGDDCIIRAGAVIGGEGFEFKTDDNCIFPVKHIGSVIIDNNVEIQQNTCIDKAIYPWDVTYIGENTKIDNLVHIAHGVRIGKHCEIVANSGIGGRVVIGDNCWIGFGATIRNGLSIGDNARVNMGAVVTKNVDCNGSVTGNFAIDHELFLAKQKNIK